MVFYNAIPINILLQPFTKAEDSDKNQEPSWYGRWFLPIVEDRDSDLLEIFTSDSVCRGECC
jgi:hypothetical protein